jgi:hypothetical protein
MFLAACLWPAAMWAQIKNTEAEAVDGKIRVTCELQAVTPQDLHLFYSEDDGQSFVPCLTVAGDLVNQTSGRKELIWDCMKDDVIMGSFVFRVTCTPHTGSAAPVTTPETTRKKAPETERKKPEPVAAKPPSRDSVQQQRTIPRTAGTEKKTAEGGFFLAPGVSFGTTTSFSLMGGYAGTWGGYAKVKSNFASKGVSVSGGMNDWYFDSGYSTSGRFSASAGIIKSLGSACFLYAGAGYGNRWIQWKSLDGQLVEIDDYSFSGLDPEAGLLLKIQKFVISAGGNCLLGKQTVFEAGIAIGFIF